MRTAVDAAVWPVQAGIEDRRRLIAVPHKHAVVRPDHIVRFDVELVDGLGLRSGLLEIGRQTRARRSGEEAQDLLSDRADPVGRNLLVCEWRAAGTVGGSRVRIVDDGRGGAQVAGAEGQRRDRRQIRLPEHVAAALVVAEEEEFVLDGAPAKGAAELVIDRVRSAGREDVLRLQLVVAMILEQAAMEIVAPGFQRDVANRASGAPQLRVVIRGAHLDRRDRLGRRNDAGQVLDVIVDSFDHVVVALVESVHYRLKMLLRVVEGGVRPVGPLHSRRQHEEILVVPVVE